MEIALNSFFSNGITVSHMIFSHHQVTQRIQIPGKIIIANHMLCNTVNDLQNSFGMALRSPYTGMDLACTTGIKENILSHNITPLLRSRHR